MVSTEPLAPLQVTAAGHSMAAATIDADFETRWAAWIVRGQEHEQRVRRRFVGWVTALSLGGAIFALIYRLLGR